MMKENILFLVEKKMDSYSLPKVVKMGTPEILPLTPTPSKEYNFMEDQDKLNEQLREDILNLEEGKEELSDSLCDENEKEDNGQDGNSGDKDEFNCGRWNEEEHKKFMEAILLYGNEWKRVQQYIKTRSSTQARSHAQKFFIRLKTKLVANNISLDSLDEQDGDKKQKYLDSIYSLLNQCLCDNGRKDGLKLDNLMKEKFSAHGREKLIKMIFNFHTKSGDYKRRKSSKADSLTDSNTEFNLVKQIQSCRLYDNDNNLDNINGFKLDDAKDANKSNLLSPKTKFFKIEKNLQLKNRKKTFDYSVKDYITSAISNDFNSNQQNLCEISSSSACLPANFLNCSTTNLTHHEISEFKAVENVYEKLKSFFGIKLNERKEATNPVWMNMIEENLNLDCTRPDNNSYNGNPFNINFDNLDGCYRNNYANVNNNFFEDEINSHNNNMNVEIEKIFNSMINMEFDYHNSFLNN